MLVWVTSVLLAAAVCAQAVTYIRRKELVTNIREGQLAALLPATIQQGTVKDQPIATSEEMKRAVSELLNYDDALFRIYLTPNAVVGIYIARWNPGKMAPRLVAAHTPDVCWPANGWKPEPMSEATQVSLDVVLKRCGFAAGEARVFVGNERPEYVLFWHKVGDEIVGYKNRWAPPRWAWLHELWRYGLGLPREQLFVRVSSNIPLEEIWQRSDFEAVRTALLNLGLARENG